MYSFPILIKLQRKIMKYFVMHGNKQFEIFNGSRESTPDRNDNTLNSQKVSNAKKIIFLFRRRVDFMNNHIVFTTIMMKTKFSQIFSHFNKDFKAVSRRQRFICKCYGNSHDETKKIFLQLCFISAYLFSRK